MMSDVSRTSQRLGTHCTCASTHPCLPHHLQLSLTKGQGKRHFYSTVRQICNEMDLLYLFFSYKRHLWCLSHTQASALLQANPDITSHDTCFPLDYMGSVISQQFDFISNFPFFDLSLNEGGFENHREILRLYLKFVTGMYLHW